MKKAFSRTSILMIAMVGLLVQAMPGLAATPRTQNYLLNNEFQSGQASGSITPGYMQDLIASAFPSALSLKNYGLPTGGDDTTAINNVITAAATAGVPVYAPAGIYKHTSAINLANVRLYGDGIGSILESTNTTTSETTCNGGPCNAIILSGTGSQLENIRVNTDWNGSRQSSGQSACVYIDGTDYTTTDFVVNNVETHNCASAGVINSGGTTGRMTGNKNYNSLADSFHNCCGAAGVVVSSNYSEGSGDDCYPVVSYAGGALTHNISVTGNVCKTSGARGLVVEGGYNVSFTGNTVEGTSSYGFLIAADSGQMSNYGITMSGNTCYNCGPSGFSAATIYGSGSGLTTHDIIFSNNILTSPVACLNLGSGGNSGPLTYNIIVNSNVCIGTSTTGNNAVNVNGVTNLTMNGNLIRGSSNSGFSFGTSVGNAGTLIMNDNTCDDINTGNNGGSRCFNMYNVEFPSMIITGNHQYNDGGGTLDNWLLMIAATNTSAIIDNNWADTTSMNVSGVTSGRVTNPGSKTTSVYGAVVSGGTFTASGCSNSGVTGSGTAGTYTSGTAGSCAVTVTLAGLTAPHGWACSAFDQTTAADVQRQSGSTTTTATITGTTASGDVIVWGCQPY